MFHPPDHAFRVVRFLHLQGLGLELIPALGQDVLLHLVKGRTDTLSNNLQLCCLLSQRIRLNCADYIRIYYRFQRTADCIIFVILLY